VQRPLLLIYVQVKDALTATGEVVLADSQVRETLAELRDSGFQGYLSLEPHWAMAGRLGGFSSGGGFRFASGALQDPLTDLSVQW
jgi:hypothetical protein